MTYKLLNKENFDKLSLEAYLYEHEKTKAKLVYVKADDDNKTFGIGFRTPPNDSKGKAHIMEHSVLNGSKKFKTKDPFMDMASSSLQTFLNAMTYPDKTIFPVSSENDKDFRNLVDVYLDAVFNPCVVEKKEILDQEGWHYTLEGDEITGISGVVYNEMQGALTNSESKIANDINALLFKGSPYEYISGGDPKVIPDLTYEEFIDFYKEHYHPSNAVIYLYGNLDIDYFMGFIDEEYLSKYDYKDVDFSINVKENYYKDVVEGAYPVSQVQEDSDYLTYAFLATSALDIKDYLTLNILTNTLFNMDSSKIRGEVVEKLNPEYFYARVGYGVRSSIIIQAQRTSASKIDDFVNIIEDGLRDASEKISEESLKSAFKTFDFSQRESLNSTSKGLNYFFMMNFDGDLLDIFRIVDVLDELRDLIGTGYYEDFVKEHFLNNKTKLVHIARPSESLIGEELAYFNERIDLANKNMTQEDLDLIRKDLEKLEAYQDKVNTEDEKATIPRLDIKDVPTSTTPIPRKVVHEDFDFILHDLPTSGLIYVSIYFNEDHLDLDDLRYLAILSELLGAIDTENISYRDIDDILWQYLASLNFNIQLLKLDKDEFERDFKVSFTTSRQDLDAAIRLVKNFATSSLFTNKERIGELLKMSKSVFESGMYDQGHLLAINRAKSHIDKLNYIKEEVSGISYYLFVKKVLKDIEEDFEGFRARLEEVYANIFTKKLSINITASGDDLDFAKDKLSESLDKLGDIRSKVEISYKPRAIKEAILTDAPVNYCSQTTLLRDDLENFTGSLALASSIVSNPYLYELIRAKGGAYGAGMSITRTLILQAYSYRDPNFDLTLENFKKIANITEELEIDQRDFENQQISTMGGFLRPISPKQKGEVDFIAYKDKSYKSTTEILGEVKATSLKDIRALAPYFRKALKAENYTIFGNREQILKKKDEFDKIIDINN